MSDPDMTDPMERIASALEYLCSTLDEICVTLDSLDRRDSTR